MGRAFSPGASRYGLIASQSLWLVSPFALTTPTIGPTVVGEYRLLRNNNGVRVEHDDTGFFVQAEKDGEVVTARLTAENTWEDAN